MKITKLAFLAQNSGGILGGGQANFSSSGGGGIPQVPSTRGSPAEKLALAKVEKVLLLQRNHKKVTFLLIYQIWAFKKRIFKNYHRSNSYT